MDVRMMQIGFAARPLHISARSSRAEVGPAGMRRASIETRLMTLGVALLMAASVAAIANQDGRRDDAHKVPQFVCDRVELVAGLTADREASDVSRVVHGDSPGPGSRDSICARDATR